MYEPVEIYNQLYIDTIEDYPDIEYSQFVRSIKEYTILQLNWGYLIVRDNEVHFNVLSKYRKRVNFREVFRIHIKPLIEYFGFVYTSVGVNRLKKSVPLALRAGFKEVKREKEISYLVLDMEGFKNVWGW